MIFSTTVVVPNVVYIPILQCFDVLVLNGPSAAANSHNEHHRVPIKRKVGDPLEPCCLSLLVCLLVFQQVNFQVGIRVVERQSDVPFKTLYGAGLFVPHLPRLPGFADFDLTEQALVITGFGTENAC